MILDNIDVLYCEIGNIYRPVLQNKITTQNYIFSQNAFSRLLSTFSIQYHNLKRTCYSHKLKLESGAETQA